MVEENQFNGKAISSFLGNWGKHPLSFYIVVLILNLSIIALLFHNTEINFEEKKYILLSINALSVGITIIVSIILLVKRQALYNILDILFNKINHHFHTLGESLENIEIGLLDKPLEDDLELLCPNTAKHPISKEARKNAAIFEFLLDLQKDCGITVPVTDKIKLGMAKFYYKDREFKKALEYISEISKHASAEAFFYQAIIYEKMRRNGSQEAFEKAKVLSRVSCWICMLKADSEDRQKIHEFIKFAENCTKKDLRNHCLNKLSKAYYLYAKTSQSNKAIMIEYMNNALENLSVAIKNFDSWNAYYNRACILCVMANLKITFSGSESNYNAGELKNEILRCLKRAFDERPALALFSCEDLDMKWIKEQCSNEFYQLLGKVFDENHGLISLA